MDSVHDLRAPGDRGERESAADRLSRDDEIGLDAVVVVDRPHPPVRPIPDWTSSSTYRIPCERQSSWRRSEVVARHGDEPALALHRLQHHTGDGRWIGVRLEEVLEGGDGVVRGDSAVGIRSRHAVDLGREGTEALLVGVHLAGHRHGEERAAVERVLERHDRGRPVAARAILTAFSTASAPELTSIERCSPARRARARRDAGTPRRTARRCRRRSTGAGTARPAPSRPRPRPDADVRGSGSRYRPRSR